MKVCITRNDEAEVNASLLRVTTALSELTDDICLLTRSRYSEENGIQKKTLSVNNKKLDNYELSIKGKPSAGLKNIIQLLVFEIKLFLWFFKNRSKYDIVHAFDFDTGLPVLLIKYLLRKKYVYHIADFYADSRNGLPEKSKPFIKRLEYAVINNAEHVIVCTEDRKEQIKGSHPKRLSVVHNTPIFSEQVNKEVTPIDKEKSGKLVFTYVGGLAERRFIKKVVDIFSEESRVELVIAGTGEATDYVKKISEKNDNISYLGKVSYKQALNLYSKSDIMFAVYDPSIPNHKYSAPNKIYEAMLTGKPIIVSKNTGIDSIVTENNMGFAIDYTEEAFKEVLEKIITVESDLESMSKNARRAYPNYSWPEMKKRIQDIYTNIK